MRVDVSVCACVCVYVCAYDECVFLTCWLVQHSASATATLSNIVAN